MLPISNFKKVLARKVASLEAGCAIDVRTYKRNRSVVFVGLGAGRFRVLENGFEERDFEVEEGDLGRVLRELQRREFPRSNKVRVYDLGEFDPDSQGSGERKIL